MICSGEDIVKLSLARRHTIIHVDMPNNNALTPALKHRKEGRKGGQCVQLTMEVKVVVALGMVVMIRANMISVMTRHKQQAEEEKKRSSKRCNPKEQSQCVDKCVDSKHDE